MRLYILGLVIGSFAGAAFAQTTTSSVSDRTPFQNVAPGAVAERAPGNTIQQALSRHQELANERLSRQRGDDTGSDEDADAETDDSTGTDSLSDLLSGGLLDSLTGGLDLGGLLGGLGGSTGGDSAIPSNITPEVIALLESAGIDINDVFPADGSTSQSREPAATDAKVESAAQDAADEPSFRIRWADAMLDTMFTSLVFAFQTPTFIDFLADAIRPLFEGTTDTGSGSEGVDPDVIIEKPRDATTAPVRSIVLAPTTLRGELR